VVIASADWLALAREIQFPLEDEFYLFELDAASRRIQRKSSSSLRVSQPIWLMTKRAPA
jgi:hypothetical protein